jgi:large subunit ribosomal protein L35
MKTRKSITKRFKITKNGKVMRRSTGINHTRSKKTGQKIRDTRKWVRVPASEARQILKALNY